MVENRSSETSSSDDQQKPPHRSRRRRRWAIAAGVLALALVVLVVVAPRLVNVPPIQRMAMAQYNRGIEGRLEVDRIEASWFSGQRLIAVRIYDPQDQWVADISGINAPDLNLLPLMFGTRDYGRVDLYVERAAIVQHDDGTMNIQRAFAAPPRPGRPEPPPEQTIRQLEATRLGLNLTADSVTYTAPQLDPVEMRDLSLKLDTLQPATIAANLSAQVWQNNETGSIAANVRVENLFGDGQLQLAQASVDADAQVDNVPATAIDRAVQGGGLETLVGERINARVQARGTPQNMQAELTAKSSNLDAQINLVRDGDLIRISDGLVRLMVTPQAWDQHVTRRPAAPAEADAATTTRLSQPFEVNVTVNKLIAPAEVGLARAGAIEADLTVSVGDIVLHSSDARIGEVALRDGQLRAQSAEVGQGLNIALRAVPEQAGRRGDLSLDVALSNLLDGEGLASPARAVADVRGSMTNLPLAFAEQLLDLDQLLVEAIGPSADVQIAGRFGPPAGSTADRPADAVAGSLRMDLTSSAMQARVDAAVEDGILTLSDATSGTLELSPQAFDVLAARFAERGTLLGDLRLAQPATMTLQVTELRVPTADLRLETMRAGFTLGVDRAALAGDPRVEVMVLEDFSIEVQPGMLAKAMDLQLNSAIRSPAAAASLGGPAAPAAQGMIHANMHVTRPLDQQRGGLMTGMARNLSSAVLEPWQEVPGRMTATFGPQVDDAQFEVDFTSMNRMPVTARLASQQVQAQIAGVYSPGQSLVLEQTNLDLRMTPASFEMWHGTARAAADDEPAAEPVRLVEPAEVQVQLRDSVIALNGANADGGAIDLAASRLNAQLRSPRLVIQQGQRPPVSVQDMLVTMAVAQSLSQEVDVTAEAQFAVNPQPGQPPQLGSLQSRNRFVKLVNEQGSVNWPPSSFEIDTQMQNVPVDAIDALLGLSALLGLDEPLSAILGDQMTVSLVGDDSPHRPGQLTLTLNSPYAQVNVPGRFVHHPPQTPGGAATRTLALRENAVATLQVHPGLSRQVLGRINPMLVNTLHGDRPIQVTVNHETFAAPLAGFDIGQLRSDIALDFGTLTLTHGGLMDVVMGMVRGPVGRTTQATVSPLNIRVADGVVEYNRFVIEGRPTQRDMVLVLNGIALGFQGSVNLGTQQLNLDVAFYPETINRMLPARARFNSDRALVIPMTGTITSPRLDDRRFYEAIARFGGAEALRDVLPQEARGVPGLLDTLLRGAGQAPAGNDTSPLAQRLPPGYQLPTATAPTEPGEPVEQPPQDEQQKPPPPAERDPLRSLFDLIERQRNR